MDTKIPVLDSISEELERLKYLKQENDDMKASVGWDRKEFHEKDELINSMIDFCNSLREKLVAQEEKDRVRL